MKERKKCRLFPVMKLACRQIKNIPFNVHLKRFLSCEGKEGMQRIKQQ